MTEEEKKAKKTAKNRAYRLANAEKVKKRHRAYRLANAEKARAYYVANAEKVKKQHRAYRLANAEKVKKQRRAYYAANAEKVKAQNNAHLYASPETHATRLLRGARLRAKKTNMPFTITLDDAPVSLVCEMDNTTPLAWCMPTGGRTWNTPSLDRIDNTKGYIPGNVWWICCERNALKADLSPEDLRWMADAIERRLNTSDADNLNDISEQTHAS